MVIGNRKAASVAILIRNFLRELGVKVWRGSRLSTAMTGEIIVRHIDRCCQGAILDGRVFHKRGGRRMKDWLMVVLPIVLVVYFVVYPDQLASVMSWASTVIPRH